MLPPIAWKSKKIMVCCLKYTFGRSQYPDSCFILQVLSEILDPYIKADSNKKLLLTIPIDAFTDNKSQYQNTQSAIMADEHRLSNDLTVIKQMLLHNELQSFAWVHLKKHLADCSTE